MCLRVCKRAHFVLRYRLFQAPIWCISRPDMVHIASRKSPFRKTIGFLRCFDEERTDAEKALLRIATGLLSGYFFLFCEKFLSKYFTVKSV